ncbi:MAG: class I SAM-dependent methyltransferase [Spirochaeta sp.]|nr:class I SAM-dependent methyltransferase [Spirochaeta sp.]
MNTDRRFRERLSAFDLGDSTSKRDYNRRLFGVVATRYDVITRVLSFGQDRHWKRVLFTRLAPRAGAVGTPGGNRARQAEILDVACGTGDLAIGAGRRWRDATVTGIDLTPEMVVRARRRAAAAEVSSRVQFVVGDMTALPVPADRFDVITAGYALRNAPDLDAAIGELYRVLQPARSARAGRGSGGDSERGVSRPDNGPAAGGIVGLLDFSRSDRPWVSTVQVGLLRVWGRLWGLLLHGNPEVYGYISESLRRFPTHDELLRRMGQAGFRRVRSRRFFFGIVAVITARK